MCVCVCKWSSLFISKEWNKCLDLLALICVHIDSELYEYMALEVKFSDLHVYCMESTIEMYGAIFPKLTHKTWETSERDVLLNMQSKKCGIQLDVNKITVRTASHLKSVKYWHKRQNICSNQSHYTRFEYFRF